MRRIAIIPGDGIGPEITAQAVNVLQAVLERSGLDIQLVEFDYGAQKYLDTGITLPEEQVEEFRTDYDAIFLGPIGDPRVTDLKYIRDLSINLLGKLDLYIYFRPVRLLNPQLCPLKDKKNSDVNFLLFAENSGGIFTSVKGSVRRGTDQEIAYSHSLDVRWDVERTLRYVFDYTQTHGLKKLTLCCRSNTLFFEDDLWERVFAEMGAEYPGIEKNCLTVRSLLLQLLHCPEKCDVIVASSQYGELIADLGGFLQGGLGLASSAYLHPGKISLFTCSQGGLLKQTFSNGSNPLGAISSVALMLESLGFEQEARWINQAVQYALETNNLTRDLGGRLSAGQVGDFIANQIRKGTW